MTDQNKFIHLVAGGLAGTTGAILTCPLEVLKTRFQASRNNSTQYGNKNVINLNFPNTSKSLLLINKSKENQKQLNTNHRFYGATPKLNSTCQAQSAYANFLLKNNPLTHYHGGNNGVIANSFIFEINHSHTICNNRQNNFLINLHNHHPEANASTTNFAKPKIGSLILSNFKNIIENEGFRGLFKGLGPNLIGVAPYRAIYFFSYANSKTFLCKFLGEEKPSLHICSAFIAGFTAVSITNPIWFVKTRLQLDETRRGKTALEVIDKILKQNGVLGFYKGISASYFGIAESAMYFVLYEKLKKLSANHTDHTLLAYFTSAGFAKTLASCLCYPHEVARTRLREEGNKYTGFFQTLSLIVKEEGMRGLYKGMGTHLIRQIPNTAIVMTTYELIVRSFSTQNNDSFETLDSNQDE